MTKIASEHEHVSDLRIDRLLAGELDDAAATALRDEASTCVVCSTRLAQLTRDAELFAQRPPLAPPARRRVWWIAAPVVLAAAAAAMLFVRTEPRPTHDSNDAGERVKGGGPILVVTAGADRLVPVSSGDRVHPGDSVQVAYTADVDGYGAVLGRDGTGKAAAYVPADGTMMVPLPAGEMMSFPGRTVLDDVVGEEIIVVVWCRVGPFALAPLLAELELRGDIMTGPGTCTHRRVVLRKETR